MHPMAAAVLNDIQNEITNEFGFPDGIPKGELYDGGIGIHSHQDYEPQFNFNRDTVQLIVQSNLEKLTSDAVHE